MKLPLFRLIQCMSLLTLGLFMSCDPPNGVDASCGVFKTVMLTKTLSPGDPYFTLSTPNGVNDSAILSKGCPVTFTLEYGYANDSVQAKAGLDEASALNLPLIGLKARTMFDVDGNAYFGEGWIVKTVTRNSTTKDFHISVTDHGNYNSDTRGIFHITPWLSPVVKSIDSSIKVYGAIQYYDGRSN